MARDRFLIDVCSPKDVAVHAGGNTKEEADVTAQKMKNEGWVVIQIKENPLTTNDEEEYIRKETDRIFPGPPRGARLPKTARAGK